MRTFFLLFLMATQSLFILSCGRSNNLFASSYKENDKQKADESMLAKDYDGAISTLTKYVNDNPQDYEATSMLARAYTLKGGVNFLNVFVSINNNLSTSKNDLYTLLNSLPTGNAQNISALQSAVSFLSQIPTNSRTQNQIYQIALTNAALGFMVASQDVLDSSGQISTPLVNAMSNTDVLIIYNSIVAVQSALTSLGIVAGNGSGSGILLNTANSIISQGSSNLKSYFLSYQ
jgi:hypothetical protein